jgi:hypothetical protein
LKQFVAIALLTIHLFTATELYQMVKLPLLIEHYLEHKEQKSDLTFWTFLKVHYSDNKLIDEDHDQDMKLPFKSDDGCINITLTAVIGCPLSDLVLKPFISEAKTFFSYEESFLPSSFLTSIWQPPKSC